MNRTFRTLLGSLYVSFSVLFQKEVTPSTCSPSEGLGQRQRNLPKKVFKWAATINLEVVCCVYRSTLKPKMTDIYCTCHPTLRTILLFLIPQFLKFIHSKSPFNILQTSDYIICESPRNSQLILKTPNLLNSLPRITNINLNL